MNDRRRIRIGNQTSFATGNVMEPFEYAVENGFDAFEWFPDQKPSGQGWAENDLSEETRVFIRDTAVAEDIRLSVHAPWHADPLDSGSLELFLPSVNLARDIDAPLFNIHFHTQKSIKEFISAIDPLRELLADAGIGLSIENTVETGPEDINELFRLLSSHKAQKKANVGMCLDLGHANLCRSTRNDYLRFIRTLSPKVALVHIHLHENYGDSDSHLPVFTGPSGKDPSGIREFIRLIKERNFSGSIILEQWPDPPGLLKDARNRLLYIIGPEKKSPDGRMVKISVDFAQDISDADKKNRSWREKLAWVHDVVTSRDIELSADKLAYLAVYLRFIGTSEVPCEEDGSHYRPSHHAKMARDIYKALAAAEAPHNVLAVRKIYPWLPSFESSFMRAEPLTRIRDIAHRNDIPGELKKEIKHTLQNKLHRNAGPEDLITSERILARITSPDAPYPASFVEEFKKFHDELREFFNARSLEDRLETLIVNDSEMEAGYIRTFLELKGKADKDKELVSALKLLTDLRVRLSEILKDDYSPRAQQVRMADIGLEEYLFVLLSRLIGKIGADTDFKWEQALFIQRMAVENLRLSGIDLAECRAIGSELTEWSKDFDQARRDHLLRLFATLGRCLRLAEDSSVDILALFRERSIRLGRLLGVDERAAKVFGEAEVRNHPVFQLSRLTALLSKRVKALAELPVWDVVVPGRSHGKLVIASGFNGLAEQPDGPVVALIEKKDEDAEIPRGVSGIIVPWEIPRLSHLAVRARQAGIVFVAGGERGRVAELKKLEGENIKLDARSGRVVIAPSRSRQTKPHETETDEVFVPDIELSSNSLVPLSEVTEKTGGRKAFNARRLEELSRREEAGFMTPGAIVVPFSVMEKTLRSSAPLRKELARALDGLKELPRHEFEVSLGKIKEIIGQLPVPAEITAGVSGRFSRDIRLMVRSSSNTEDLGRFSGAGLHDTVAGVLPGEIGDAVKTVWASLWNRRAAESRMKAGIDHRKAHMAVLIQEMVDPEFSFILHTVDPVTLSSDNLYMEIAPGLGETLASAETPGQPYRAVWNKRTGSVKMLAFANFSIALSVGPEGSLVKETVDYSTVGLSREESVRTNLMGRVGKIGMYIEKETGRPQDIEGLVRGDEIYLVQARPQQGDISRG